LLWRRANACDSDGWSFAADSQPGKSPARRNENRVPDRIQSQTGGSAGGGILPGADARPARSEILLSLGRPEQEQRFQRLAGAFGWI